MTRKTGDRAALLLCVAGIALLVLGGFTKLWVGRHGTEYTQIFRLGGPRLWVVMVLELTLFAVWLLGNIVGLTFAYRMRGHSSIRYAAIAAALGVIAMIITNTGIPLWTVRKLWTVLVWLPFVTTIAVFASSAYWLHDRQSLFEPAATGNG
jgi:hypothetical protein